jgi:hypothetical protein
MRAGGFFVGYGSPDRATHARPGLSFFQPRSIPAIQTEAIMTEEQKTLTGLVRGQVEAIVAGGKDVRKQISQLVTEAAEKFHLHPEGLIELTRSVMDGAATVIQRAVPQEPESTLRQVIDGLGDGFSTVALAGKLAIEEADARRKAFAAEDLTKLTRDLKALGDLFVDTVSTTGGKFKSITTAQLGALRRHAQHTRDRIQPSLESALAAAAKQPMLLARESVEAGVSLSRQGLGALFTAVGHLMYSTGEQLAGERRPVAPLKP